MYCYTNVQTKNICTRTQDRVILDSIIMKSQYLDFQEKLRLAPKVINNEDSHDDMNIVLRVKINLDINLLFIMAYLYNMLMLHKTFNIMMLTKC